MVRVEIIETYFGLLLSPPPPKRPRLTSNTVLRRPMFAPLYNPIWCSLLYTVSFARDSFNTKWLTRGSLLIPLYLPNWKAHFSSQNLDPLLFLYRLYLLHPWRVYYCTEKGTSKCLWWSAVFLIRPWRRTLYQTTYWEESIFLWIEIQIQQLRRRRTLCPRGPIWRDKGRVLCWRFRH